MADRNKLEQALEALLNESAAAQVLLLRRRTLSRWRWEGKGPAYCKIGGAVRYRLADLEVYISGNRVAAND